MQNSTNLSSLWLMGQWLLWQSGDTEGWPVRWTVERADA